jgi:hypothetical protein
MRVRLTYPSLPGPTSRPRVPVHLRVKITDAGEVDLLPLPSLQTSAQVRSKRPTCSPKEGSIPPTSNRTSPGHKQRRACLASGASGVQAELVSRPRESQTLRRTHRFRCCGGQSASAFFAPFLATSAVPHPTQMHPQASPDDTSAGESIRPLLSPKLSRRHHRRSRRRTIPSLISSAADSDSRLRALSTRFTASTVVLEMPSKRLTDRASPSTGMLPC